MLLDPSLSQMAFIVATSVNLALLGLLFVSVWCFSSANFVFDFRLSSVTTHVTCDWGRYSVCETYVTFCLRERSSSESTSANDCPLGSSGRINAHPLQGTPEKMITSQERWPGGFQMYVRAMDEDPANSDDFLDDIFITRTLQVNNAFTEVMEYTGDWNSVTVGMSFRVRCQKNYYGADCDTFCVAQDDDENGHYTCNNDGTIQCREGFEDASNECRDRVTDSCDSSPCGNNGECSRVGKSNYICECNNGYSGPDCSECELGFEKQGDECIQIILQPTLNTDNPTTSSAAVNQTVSNEVDDGLATALPDSARSGDDVATDSNLKTIISAIVVAMVVLILGVIIIVVLVIVITKLKRKKHYHKHQGEEALASMKKKEMTVSSEKTFDNPTYDSNEFTTSYHTGSRHPEQVFPDSTTVTYATPTSPDDTTRIVNNPVYGDSNYTSDDYEEGRHVQNPIYGDPTDDSDQLYTIPQPLGTEACVSTSERSTEMNGATLDRDVATKEMSTTDGFHTYAVVDKSKKKNTPSNKQPLLPPPKN